MKKICKYLYWLSANDFVFVNALANVAKGSNVISNFDAHFSSR
jgi:hypothetical protein